MGKKRKQSKQTLCTIISVRQKKRRKTQGKGFRRLTKEDGMSSLPQPGDVNEQLRSTPYCSREESFCGISTIVPRLRSLGMIFQRSQQLGQLSSIRNVFIFLDWLKQIFGCGLQTLGKFLSETERDKVNKMNRGNKFEEIVRRMKNLEEEVKFLKTEVAKKTHCSYGDYSNACTSHTCQQGSFVGSISHPSSNAQPAPPPPPPPPPPVLAPPPPPLACLKKNQNGLKDVNSKETKNLPPRTMVTLEDLKKVKLRKVKKASDKENLSPSSESMEKGCQSDKQPTNGKSSLKRLRQRENLPQCVVSLNEIKRVTLKRTKSENEVEKIKLRSPGEMVMMRRNLRKVNVVRSPGETPLMSDRSYESGNGLTPMMTKALRRKFQQAHPYSPDSPKGTTTKRQSFSPLADLSRNTPSPLLLNNKF